MGTRSPFARHVVARRSVAWLTTLTAAAGVIAVALTLTEQWAAASPTSPRSLCPTASPSAPPGYCVEVNGVFKGVNGASSRYVIENLAISQVYLLHEYAISGTVVAVVSDAMPARATRVVRMKAQPVSDGFAGDARVRSDQQITMTVLSPEHERFVPIALKQPTPAPTSTPRPACDASYPDVCIPSPPPLLSCSDVPFRNFRVITPDPHGFDGDHDGIGCET